MGATADQAAALCIAVNLISQSGNVPRPKGTIAIGGRVSQDSATDRLLSKMLTLAQSSHSRYSTHDIIGPPIAVAGLPSPVCPRSVVCVGLQCYVNGSRARRSFNR